MNKNAHQRINFVFILVYKNPSQPASCPRIHDQVKHYFQGMIIMIMIERANWGEDDIPIYFSPKNVLIDDEKDRAHLVKDDLSKQDYKIFIKDKYSRYSR